MRAIFLFAILFATAVQAEEPVKTPLKDVWAYFMPGTKEVTKLEPLPENVSEKDLSKIHRDSLVVEFRGDVLPGMAVVARGVVDQHRGRPERGFQGTERPLQILDVAEVAALEGDRRASVLKLLGERRAALRVEVDEADPGTLRRKSAHHLHADAARTAADEDHLALEARIDCEGFRHVLSLIRRFNGIGCAG